MSSGNAVLKASLYSANALSLFTTLSSSGMPISIGFRIGSRACAARFSARPSQNCAICHPAFSTVGVLRSPEFPTGAR